MTLRALDNKTIITKKHELLTCFKDHFATVLNEQSTVEHHAVNNIEQRPTSHMMSKCPDLYEMSKVIFMLGDGYFLGQTDWIQNLFRAEVGGLSSYATLS